MAQARKETCCTSACKQHYHEETLDGGLLNLVLELKLDWVQVDASLIHVQEADLIESTVQLIPWDGRWGDEADCVQTAHAT